MREVILIVGIIARHNHVPIFPRETNAQWKTFGDEYFANGLKFSSGIYLQFNFDDGNTTSEQHNSAITAL